jgi:glutathione S-transferase
VTSLNNMYRLHSFCQSGNSFKVAFLLRALNQPWEPVFVDFMNGVTREASWREQANEMGEVPVLAYDTPSGPRKMTQSGVILTYLAKKHGGHNGCVEYGGKTEDEQQDVLRWLLFDNHKFTSYFATYRFMKAFGPTAPDPAVMAWLRGRLDNAFGIVDKHLANREFMVGKAATIADISLCGYLFYPVEESGYEVAQRFSHIGAWLERLRALPGWASPYDILPGNLILPKW